MYNVLLEIMPDEWKGYSINANFQVGIQIYNLYYDHDVQEWEKTNLIIYLLFADDETGMLRSHPIGNELEECIVWFLNGWYHDKQSGKIDKRRLIDYDADQWRIYADFRQIYGIDLSESEMHWWEFCGLLWNMPYKQSSLLQVIDIRRREITSKMGKEEKDALKEAKAVYEIEQPEIKKEYTQEETQKIDAFDAMMTERRKKKD